MSQTIHQMQRNLSMKRHSSGVTFNVGSSEVSSRVAYETRATLLNLGNQYNYASNGGLGPGNLTLTRISFGKGEQ